MTEQLLIKQSAQLIPPHEQLILIKRFNKRTFKSKRAINKSVTSLLKNTFCIIAHFICRNIKLKYKAYKKEIKVKIFTDNFNRLNKKSHDLINTSEIVIRIYCFLPRLPASITVVLMTFYCFPLIISLLAVTGILHPAGSADTDN